MGVPHPGVPAEFGVGVSRRGDRISGWGPHNPGFRANSGAAILGLGGRPPWELGWRRPRGITDPGARGAFCRGGAGAKPNPGGRPRYHLGALHAAGWGARNIEKLSTGGFAPCRSGGVAATAEGGIIKYIKNCIRGSGDLAIRGYGEQDDLGVWYARTRPDRGIEMLREFFRGIACARCLTDRSKYAGILNFSMY